MASNPCNPIAFIHMKILVFIATFVLSCSNIFASLKISCQSFQVKALNCLSLHRLLILIFIDFIFLNKYDFPTTLRPIQDHHAFVISMQRESKTQPHLLVYKSTPFSKVFKCDLKFLVEFLRIILSAQEIIKFLEGMIKPNNAQSKFQRTVM